MGFQLTQEEGEFLVKLSRRAVETYLKNDKMINAPGNTPSRLLQRGGVFVTIKKILHDQKKLRGCIGYPYATTKLAQAVIECAISSATQDPRFHPISTDEFDQIVFEVSVLTPPEIIGVDNPRQLPSKIIVGEDGLIVEKGILKGLLLPQVPVDCNWNEEEFLSRCCIKAGLTPDSWLIKTTKIYKFQAIVFEEEEARGEIKRKELYRK
ncbi:MAG: TIGR00296 family protein [Candidatus Bathyarchaeota archaeon]|nr:MAG: TIGR00296 family protein [Candidatus Bathyarchaeota archaeon]